MRQNSIASAGSSAFLEHSERVLGGETREAFRLSGAGPEALHMILKGEVDSVGHVQGVTQRS